jgi:hypothetical protein
MSAPSNYQTIKGLLKATEKVLQQRAKGVSRADGMSVGMWLANARYMARTRFGEEHAVAELITKFGTTRPQDLLGGHSLFGVPLPMRAYNVGDNVPGVGRVDDCTETQLCIGGQWYHRSIIDDQQVA